MEEIWKEIDNTDGNYLISNLGRIKRLKHYNGKITLEEKIIYQHKGNNGYYRLSYAGKRQYAHILVAKYFVPNPHNYPQVNHIDGDKSNNRANNLEWVTALMNMQHASQNHLINTDSQKRKEQIKQNRLIAVENAKKPVAQYNLQGELLNTYNSVSEAGDITNICKQNIAEVCRGIKYRKTAGGFIWKYI
jgi:hypothetical protein